MKLIHIIIYNQWIGQMVFVFMNSLMFTKNNLVICYLLIIDYVQTSLKTKMKLLAIKFWLLFEISFFWEREINKQTSKSNQNSSQFIVSN